MPKPKAQPETFSQYSEPRPKGVKVDTVIIHSMYNPDAKDPLAIEACRDILNKYQVSAHYLVSRRGQVANVVPEDHVAWHAGVARLPDGRKKVNRYSIGIELINFFEKQKFSESQYKALIKLLKEISKRHSIKFILGHDFVARPTGRKSDPGRFFEWDRIKKALVKVKPSIRFG